MEQEERMSRSSGLPKLSLCRSSLRPWILSSCLSVHRRTKEAVLLILAIIVPLLVLVSVPEASLEERMLTISGSSGRKRTFCTSGSTEDDGWCGRGERNTVSSSTPSSLMIILGATLVMTEKNWKRES